MVSANRNIPGTMATQHPDHASVPYWLTDAFIPVGKEVEECYRSFFELGVQEYMWDWEGKIVDEAVLDRLFMEHGEYFRDHHLGKDKFLTFRLPNPKVETEYRLARVFAGMMNASALARHMDYGHDPLFEVILPMTESATEMIEIQEAFRELASLKHPLLKFGETSFTHIELIPLFETIQTIARSDIILSEYLDVHKKKFGFTPTYIRPFIARSDPALNSGIIPTVLSIKIGLHKVYQLAQQCEIDIYPILGAAALPFRGGLTPHTVQDFIREYGGIRTTTIQGGFKYDYPKNDVVQAIEELERLLPTSSVQQISDQEITMMEVMFHEGELLYRNTIESIAPVVNDVATYLPKRRERVQHVGLFGYSRGVGSVRLPRAIGFTGALYSIGIPPEVIATGRIIAKAKKNGMLSLIETYYTLFQKDLMRSGRFINYDVLRKLSGTIKGFEEIAQDVAYVEEYFDMDFGPQTDAEKEHKQLADVIFSSVQNGTVQIADIQQAAVLRKSLG